MGGFDVRHNPVRQIVQSVTAAFLLVAVPFANRAAAGATSPGLRGPANAGFASKSMGRLVTGSMVSLDGISLLVPPPGGGVWGAAARVDGSRRTVGLQTSPDGKVMVYETWLGGASGGADTGGSEPATSLSNCSDSAYKLEGSAKWHSTWTWYFNVGSTPSEVHQDKATSALRDAAGNITGAHNDCGLPDNVNAHHAYKGTTSKSANIGTNSSCKSSDGTSVVDFGDLALADLGFACYWTQGSSVVEGDMRLNKADYSWVVIIGDGCVTKYSVEDAATHEFGHIFGLADLSASLHPNLTMSAVMLPCQNSQTSLGLGDVKGLEAQY